MRDPVSSSDGGSSSWQRLWRRLASMNFGTLALLSSGSWLAVGATTVYLAPRPFRPLLHAYLVDWFSSVWTRPWLWWWMPLLFLSVGAMGLSTAACILDELRALFGRQGRDARCRKLAMAAFHGCVILFLLGHLFMEFTGTNRLHTLRRGELFQLAEEGLELSLVAIEDRALSEDARSPRLRRLTLELRRGGNRALRRPAMLSPCFFQGLELHVPLYGQPTDEGEARVQVRRNPGLPFLIAGVGVLFLAVALFGLAMFLRPGKELRRFTTEGN